MGLGGWGFGVGVLAPGRLLRESCFRRDRDPFPVVGLGFGVSGFLSCVRIRVSNLSGRQVEPVGSTGRTCRVDRFRVCGFGSTKDLETLIKLNLIKYNQ